MYKVDKRKYERTEFSSYSELVVQQTNAEQRVHVSGFVGDASVDGVKFTTSDIKARSIEVGDVGTIYIDPELESEKIFTFLVKITRNDGNGSIGLKFIGGDLNDVAEFKKLVEITKLLIFEENNKKL
jgi:hypothetical protein